MTRERFISSATSVVIEAMEDRGVSRSELAERMGRSKGFVSQILSGDRNMTLGTLAEIGRALGVGFTIGVHEPAPASPVPGGDEVWRCPGCGTEYVRDVGECGQLQPWNCTERVVSMATWRAALAVARAADADGCFEDLDAAREARDRSGVDNYADEVRLSRCDTLLVHDCAERGCPTRDYVAVELLTSDEAVKAAAAVVMRMEGRRAPTDTATAALEAVAARLSSTTKETPDAG